MKRGLVVLVVFLVLLAAVGAAAYYLYQTKRGTEEPLDPAIERIVTKEIDARLQVGDDEGALELVENMLKKYNDDSSPEKKALLSAKARVLIYQDKVTEALALYRLLESEYGEHSYGTYLTIATLAEETGDKTLAKEYYKKALGVLNPNDPLYEVDKAGLQAKVDSL